MVDMIKGKMIRKMINIVIDKIINKIIDMIKGIVIDKIIFHRMESINNAIVLTNGN